MPRCIPRTGLGLVVYRCRWKIFLLRFLLDYCGIWDAGGRISTILLDQKVATQLWVDDRIIHVLSHSHGPVFNLSHLHNLFL